MRFSALTGVHPMIETYPLAKAGEAYQRMISNKARFRVVLTMEQQQSVYNDVGHLCAF